MKDLIIGGSTNYDWDKLKYWVNSINKSGFEGDKVLILFNCDKNTVDKVVAAGFTVVAVNKDADGTKYVGFITTFLDNFPAYLIPVRVGSNWFWVDGTPLLIALEGYK